MIIGALVLGAVQPMANYYSIIARAVSRLPSKTAEARHAIYERARTAVQKSLRTYESVWVKHFDGGT